MNIRNLSLAAAIVLALGVAGTAAAGDATDNLTLQVEVANECTLSTPDQLFNVDGLSATQVFDVPNGILVSCNAGTAYSVSPGDGMNFGMATNYETDRAMMGGPAAEFIAYRLSLDSTGAQDWGTSGNAISGVATGGGATDSHGYAVKLLGVNTVAGGIYGDTLTVTATY